MYLGFLHLFKVSSLPMNQGRRFSLLARASCFSPQLTNLANLLCNTLIPCPPWSTLHWDRWWFWSATHWLMCSQALGAAVLDPCRVHKVLHREVSQCNCPSSCLPQAGQVAWHKCLAVPSHNPHLSWWFLAQEIVESSADSYQTGMTKSKSVSATFTWASLMVLKTINEVKPSHCFGVHDGFTDGWELHPGVEQASSKKRVQIHVSPGWSVWKVRLAGEKALGQ